MSLQERYRQVAKAHFNLFQENLLYLRNFVAERTALAAIVANTNEIAADLDARAWIETHSSRQGIDLPPSEAGRAKLLWHLIGEWADGQRRWVDDSGWVSSEREYQSRALAICEQFIEPFIDYLQERLGTESEMLHLLARYKRRVEWFEGKALHERYRQDTAHGEAIYDEDLRHFLFDQGVDNPFSQPRSASGEADVVAFIDTVDPLICEVKLFDGEGNGVAHVATGLQQALRYANDYHKPVGYLVVFNLSHRHLVFPQDRPDLSWPPTLVIGEVGVHVIVVQALPLASASQQGKPESLVISRERLLEVVAA